MEQEIAVGHVQFIAGRDQDSWQQKIATGRDVDRLQRKIATRIATTVEGIKEVGWLKGWWTEGG
ncbi:hypothetical protein GW17_00062155, partial [Ensete ventricosum]